MFELSFIQKPYDKVLAYLYGKGINCAAWLKMMSPGIAVLYIAIFLNSDSIKGLSDDGTYAGLIILLSLFTMDFAYNVYKDLSKIEKNLESEKTTLPVLTYGKNTTLGMILRFLYVMMFPFDLWTTYPAPPKITIVCNILCSAVIIICLFGCSAHHMPPTKRTESFNRNLAFEGT